MNLQERAIRRRNKCWKDNPLIPVWVDIDNVALDEFYTRPEIAEDCYISLLNKMQSDYANHSLYRFVDPSAGNGVFYDLLPENRRIGIEIAQKRPEFEKTDFLSWEPMRNGCRYAVVGNPPFGYRAWLALAFLNHAAGFADYVGLILPMAFQSDGKGSPKHRVEGAELIQQTFLPKDSFIKSDGSPVSINALWQIWRRGVNNQPPKKTCNSWIDLFTVDMRKERLCGQERMDEADWFLQRTFFRDPLSLVKDFDSVRYVCGYGIVIHKAKRQIVGCLNSIDWRNYSNLATHNCRHISMYHIRRALTDNGFYDA